MVKKVLTFAFIGFVIAACSTDLEMAQAEADCNARDGYHWGYLNASKFFPSCIGD